MMGINRRSTAYQAITILVGHISTADLMSLRVITAVYYLVKVGMVTALLIFIESANITKAHLLYDM